MSISWNYRVMEFILEDVEGKPTYRQIHEVYYDDDGKPSMYAEEAATVYWEELKGNDPHWQLDMMREALSKPVLHDSDFPTQEGVEEPL